MTTIASRVATVSASIETATRAGEFAEYARLLVAGGGNRGVARQLAETSRANPRVVELFRAAVTPGATDGWGQPITALHSVAQSFAQAVGSVGLFDKLLPSMLQVPPRTRVVAVTMLSTGTRVGQGQIKPISDLAISGNDTDEMKASAIIVVSNELAQLGGAVAARLFSDVLRKACALAIDQQFLDTVLTGISPTASSGNTSIAILEDVAALYASVDSDASSKLFFVTDSAGAKFLSAKVTSTGEIAFPTMAPSGGTLAGTPVVVADAAQGKLVLLDASAIAVAVSDLRLDSTATASLQLDTEPDSPPTASTTLRSLFQTNETALRCERWFSVEVLRATAAAYVDVSWSGNSPTL